jgi:ribosomal protein L11 methylase PrmA
VIVRRPGRKRLELEIVCRSRRHSSTVLEKFGGRIEALPRNWLKRFRGDSKPLKIGKRLVIVRSMNEAQNCGLRLVRRSLGEGGCVQRNSHRGARADALSKARSTARTIKPALLVIPASAAFGAGEHATTAMSLRLLEQLTRCWNPGWSLADLGTGTGILSLTAKRFGAGRVIGIDNDPTAISMAKSNARLNKIRGVSFESGDVRRWNPARETDVITANLYSDLLIEILPEISGSSWLILSGILRSQEGELFRALQRNHLDIISIKRRGKWTAFLARRGQRSATTEP